MSGVTRARGTVLLASIPAGIASLSCAPSPPPLFFFCNQDRVAISIENSPQSFVLVGAPDVLTRLANDGPLKGHNTKPLPISVCYHGGAAALGDGHVAGRWAEAVDGIDGASAWLAAPLAISVLRCDTGRRYVGLLFEGVGVRW